VQREESSKDSLLDAADARSGYFADSFSLDSGISQDRLAAFAFGTSTMRTEGLLSAAVCQ
jgi:hypothetical protein